MVSGLSIGGYQTINFESRDSVCSREGRCKLQIHKVLFVFKLTLVLVLSIVVIRTVILPQKPTEIFQPASAGGTENISTEGAGNTIDASAKDYSALIAQNIFGVTDVSDIEEKISETNKVNDVPIIAEEELNLELIGTVCGNTVVSRAIIRHTKSKKLGMYKKGQNINGARIESIEENAVILLHNGQRKMLTLSRVGGNNNNTRLLSSSVIDKTSRGVNPVLPTEESLGDNPIKIVLIETILKKAAIEPYVVDGQVEGLKITDLDEIPMAKAFGLKEGDVIQRVNGHRLINKQQAYQVFKKARSEVSMDLELLSDGQTSELSFNLQ
jgi:type II secretion system protein C